MRSSPGRAAQDLAQAGSAPAFGVQRPARRRLAQAPAGSQVQVLVRTAADAPADAVQQVVNALAGAQASGQTLADLKAAGAPTRGRLRRLGFFMWEAARAPFTHPSNFYQWAGR
jgi:hypothetical protein